MPPCDRAPTERWPFQTGTSPGPWENAPSRSSLSAMGWTNGGDFVGSRDTRMVLWPLMTRLRRRRPGICLPQTQNSDHESACHQLRPALGVVTKQTGKQTHWCQRRLQLTLAGTRHFAILHGTSRGWCDPPPSRLALDWAWALIKKPACCLSRDEVVDNRV